MINKKTFLAVIYVRHDRTLRETTIRFEKISYVDISLKFITDSDYAILGVTGRGIRGRGIPRAAAGYFQ